MAAPTIQFKRGAFVNLPGLQAGEPGFTTDKYDLYVGLTSETSTNKFFGSHRYWGREDGTLSLKLKLVDKDGINSIDLKSPNTLAGIVTYVLPGTQGASSSVLTNDGSGNLTWGSGSSNAVFSGITTFSDTTDNTLGNENTGSIQIDGGVGIAKNLTVKENLYVGGYSEFVGVVTFKGGTINLGDGNTDNVNVAGEFVSNLIPNDDATYDIGNGSQRWRNASFSGIGTFTTGAVVDSVRIGIANAGEIDTTGGNLTIDSAGGTVVIDDELEVAGDIKVGGGDIKAPDASVNITLTSNILTAFAGDIKVGGNDIQASDGTVAVTLSPATGNVGVSSNLTVAGNLYVNGSTTQVNTTTLTVEDTLVELGLVDGNIPNSDVNKDLGILFNYFTDSAKKSALYWDDSISRIVLASEVSETSSVLTASAHAALEIGSLWVSDCAGQSQVISCTGNTRNLENITIDGGSF